MPEVSPSWLENHNQKGQSRLIPRCAHMQVHSFGNRVLRESIGGPEIAVNYFKNLHSAPVPLQFGPGTPRPVLTYMSTPQMALPVLGQVFGEVELVDEKFGILLAHKR